MIKNVYWSSCKVSVMFVRFQWHLNSLLGFSKNTQMSNFVDFRPVGAELYTDGQTDITEAKSANSPRNSRVFHYFSRNPPRRPSQNSDRRFLSPHTTHLSTTDRQMDFVSTWRCVRRQLSVTNFSSISPDTGRYLERFLRNRPSTRVFYESAGLVSQNPQDINVLTRVTPLCTLGLYPQGTVSHQT